MKLDNNKRYRATVIPLTFPGDEPQKIEVCSTANHPDSSYGFQVWCDRDGRSYGQIQFSGSHLCYDFTDIREVSEAEAEAFFDGD